jgi:DnaJ like chaperone protein
MIRILVNIAKIDGIVSRDEILTIQRFFQYNLHYTHTQLAWVKEQIKEAINTDESIESLIEEFKLSFEHGARLILLELIYQIIYTKTPVPTNELHIAKNIADYLNISPYDRRSIESKFTQRQSYQQYKTHAAHDNEQHQYYAVLGLKSGADMAAIKKAYRSLSMKYHPDKVGHLGEEFRKIAEEKMKEINRAYDYFNKK